MLGEADSTLRARDDRAAQALGQLHFAWHVPLFRAGQELLAGRLDEAERLAAEALALGRRAHDPLVVITTRSCWSGSGGSRGGCPSWRRPSAGSSTGSRPTSAGGRPWPCCCARPAAVTRPASTSSGWRPMSSPACPATTCTCTTWPSWPSPARPLATGDVPRGCTTCCCPMPTGTSSWPGCPRHPRVGIPAPGPAGRDPVPLGRGGGPLHGGHAGPRAHGRRPVPGRRPCRARPSPPGREGAGTGQGRYCWAIPVTWPRSTVIQNGSATLVGK